MREMKYSGIDVVSIIPCNWSIRRIKYLLAERNEKVSEANPEDLLSVSEYYGVAPRAEKIKSDEILMRAESLEGYKVCKPNDMVINIMLAWKGALGVSNYHGVVSPSYCVHFSKTDDLYMKYLQYLFSTDAYKNYFRQHSSGIIDSRLRLYTDEMYSLWCVLPPLSEQHRIADFLDSKCSQIDEISKKIQEEIDTLEEYKKSVITEAVTKGLDPNVEMKDSGVEWNPLIPIHWSVTNPKALFRLRNDRAKRGDKQLTASQEYGVIYQDEYMELTNTKIVTVQKDFDILKRVYPEDFVISMRSFQGGLEYSERLGSISSAYVMLIPNKKLVFTPFYRWFFKSSKYINALQSTTNLVRDGQAMRYANFVKVPLFDVPVEEQRAIANYLDKKCYEINEVLNAKKQQLSTLEEYKKSLIYEYVTGKKEVPDANA